MNTDYFAEMVKAVADSSPRTQSPSDMFTLSEMLAEEASRVSEKVSARTYFGVQHAHDQPRSGVLLIIWEDLPLV